MCGCLPLTGSLTSLPRATTEVPSVPRHGAKLSNNAVAAEARSFSQSSDQEKCRLLPVKDASGCSPSRTQTSENGLTCSRRCPLMHRVRSSAASTSQGCIVSSKLGVIIALLIQSSYGQLQENFWRSLTFPRRRRKWLKELKHLHKSLIRLSHSLRSHAK